MSTGNYQQKKSRPVSRIPKDDALGTGEEPKNYYSAAHPDTVAIYDKSKLKYKNTAEQDSEEMFMDRIMTPDGDFVVDREVIVMTRFKTYDMKEWLMLQEMVHAETPLGNPQRFAKQRDVSSHDEPVIEQRMVPGSGEQIRKKGESVLYHKPKYDIPFTHEAIEEAMTRVREPLRLQLYAWEQGQRPYRVRKRDIWETYEWEELMRYCLKGETKESRAEKLMSEMVGLKPDDKMRLIEALLAGASKEGMQFSVAKTTGDNSQTPAPAPVETPTETLTIEETATFSEEEDKQPKKGKK